MYPIKNTSLFFATALLSVGLCASAFAGTKLTDAPVGKNVIVDETTLEGRPLNLRDELDRAAQPAAAAAVTDTGELVRGLGDGAPNIVLPNARGEFGILANIVQRGPVLVLFIRGTTHVDDLRQILLLQKNIERLYTFGIQVLAISPEPLDTLARVKEKYGLGFDILSDNQNLYATQLGLVQNGVFHPGLFGVNTDGRIASVQVMSDSVTLFDLNQATAPFRPATFPTAPAQAVEGFAAPSSAPAAM
jgi:peroxiredoxin